MTWALVGLLVVRVLYLEARREELREQLRGALRNVNALLRRAKIVYPVSRN